MNHLQLAFIAPMLLLAALWTLDSPCAAASPEPLRVCATTPDLGCLAREVGGEDVTVTVFVRGPEDPHFLEARPSFVKALSQADVYVQVGLELEVGWAPAILQNARNGRVLPGGPGYVEASVAISPLEVPTVTVDRSMGDVHPYGNPHYLLDPICGLGVARLLSDRFASLRPEKKAAFAERFASLRKRIGAALFGGQLAAKYDPEKLALLQERGGLDEFLKSQADDALLGGWLAALRNARGAKAVGDHNMWPYFARRFGVQLIGYMEPKPGVSPTTKHLGLLVKDMQAQQAKLVLSSPYVDARHARFLAENTGAAVVALAHQCEALPGTEHYLEMVAFNVKQLAAALGGTH